MYLSKKQNFLGLYANFTNLNTGIIVCGDHYHRQSNNPNHNAEIEASDILLKDVSDEGDKKTIESERLELKMALDLLS